MQRCPNYNICRGFYIFSWLCTSRQSLSGRSAILTIHWGFSSVKVQDLDCCVFPLFSVVPQFNANNAPLWTVFFFVKLYENICGLYYYLLTSLIQNKILLFPLKTATLHDRITQSHHHQGNNEILFGIHCTFLLLKCRCPKPQSQYCMLKRLTSSSHLTRPVPPGSLVSGYLYSAAGYYGIFGTSLGMTHTIVLQPDT